MPTNQSQIILLLLVFSVGIVLGAIIAWLIAGREKEIPPNQELEKSAELRQQYQERISLWVERSSGKLVVRIDNQMASTPQQLNEPQRKQLQTLMREWLSWMGFPGSSSQAPAASAAPVEPAHPGQTVLITPPPTQDVSTPPAFQATATNQAPFLPATAVTVTPVPPAKAPQKQKSIVEQIDDILQEKLESSPACNKGVRLVEDPKLGVAVWIGLERFNGVDAVVDPDVIAVLKAAVAEWEHRAGKT